ncbi:MAG: 2-amino-4-hydroxy-6-hydroxymethyldihydropteridine diphosphokinase [Flavobacteriales bacterium]|jgi:2-amino-4-hydroxy-6-hydroxymethyldihydropteridine diphosphokinase|nr:2-amino-4-hydroxy-6-hydroxymethyldihydropteridine diphosphokinase [Flavobacteriales bacterium]MDG1440038.1 2-amino-4-hydroxy-6-hydroxymethyldihydropteridine diphosphokinase [Flavobacteriales bacterium]MDG1797501.1 2-amino-4-hydroxy-6-hydroxymethyldihydropteridine diphosphokinase [Flavobacteriales bacterium]|tara:strand:- start:1400 stop:1900 length:501 start_codon:yes stop_codon:yes gene_type:complete
MTYNDVVISIGTNLGNKIDNVRIALEQITKLSDIEFKSKIYLSEPWGFESKNSFLNMAVLVKTSLQPKELLMELKKIENEMGRLKKVKNEYEDRIIDLDILIFDQKKINSNELIVPHPRIRTRKFSILVLKDLFHNQRIPVLNNTADEMLQKVNDHSKIEVQHVEL